MNRSFVILVGALALGAAIFAGSFCASQRATVSCCAKPEDDLDWLRTEFHLSDAEMLHVRELHRAYLPKCAELCAKIAEKKSELKSILGSSTNLTTEAKIKLTEIAELRAQCQTQMLQHFLAVSQTMPPTQGQRYLAEMKRLTLGTNDSMESHMTGSGDTGHEHHH
jgi:hypothetical protein